MTAADRPYDNPFAGSIERRALYEYHLAMDCTLPLLARWGIDVKGARVLDLGCGTGGLSVALAEHGAECWGIDHQAERISLASQMAAAHGVQVQLLVDNILEMDDWGQAAG